MKKQFSINDPIHSRIPLSEVEQSVIDHRIFQRLRRIKALGLLEKVFPSARHSRFEHSIGVCHVAGKALKSLLLNQTDVADLSLWKKDDNYRPWSKVSEFLDENRVQQIRLAALLHDVGHGPFSHASEDIMPTRTALIKNNKELPQFIVEALRKKTKQLNHDQADHEDYSLLLSWTILHDIQHRHHFINESYIIDTLAFKFEYVDPSNTANHHAFDLFRSFVDGDFDGDRMDYLLRDSYFCGVPYGQYDLVRLLEGLYVLEEVKSKKLILGLKRTSLAAFEDFLFARFQMHSQVYSHRIDGGYNSALTTLTTSSRRKLPAEIAKYAKIDDESFLFSSIMKPSSHIANMILDRAKWTLIYETTNQKNDTSQDVFEAVQKKVGKAYCSINKSNRPLRKPAVLEMPVVGANRISGEISTEKLHHIALLLKEFDALFFARRIFVHPKKRKAAVKVVESLTKPTENKKAGSISKHKALIDKGHRIKSAGLKKSISKKAE